MINTDNKNSPKKKLIQFIHKLELSFPPPYSLEQIQDFFYHDLYFIFFLFLKNQENSFIPTIKSSHFFKNHNQNLLENILNTCIGYVLYQKIPTEKIIELHKIIIDPLYRNQKLGTFLIKRSIRYIKKLKHYNRILLEVSENNLPAIQFYKKIGFEVIYIRKKYYSNNSNAIIMQLNL